MLSYSKPSKLTLIHCQDLQRHNVLSFYPPKSCFRILTSISNLGSSTCQKHPFLKNDLVLLSLYIFWRNLDERFHVWMSKRHIIVNFVIQKLKNKHISLKKYTDWAILGHVTQNLEFWNSVQKMCPLVALFFFFIIYF